MLQITNLKMFINVFCLLLFTISSTYSKQTYLRPADGGSSNVYNLINSVWGASATSEMPDCSDPAFGHHVNQGMDDQLNKQVEKVRFKVEKHYFLFH